jgi:hypothetical protein
MKLRTLALATFLCGCVLLGISLIKVNKAKAVESEPTTVRSFVMQSLVSQSENGASLTPIGFYIRAVSSTGEWKETRYSFDGKVSALVGAKDGLYVINENSKQLYGESNPELFRSAMRSEEKLQRSPQFIGTDEVAGIKTYVLRHKMGDEGHYSPLTGATPLKLVFRASLEGPPVRVIEALSVEFRPVSEEEVSAGDLPVELDVIRERVESLKRAGANQQAQRLEQFIELVRVKAK